MPNICISQILETELMHLGYTVCPISADTEAVQIAHDEEGRVFQSQSILLELGECCVEVLPFAFVFPAEVVALPNIRPTLATTRFCSAALECVPLAFRVDIGRRGLINQSA